jgi:long-subunit acyl-CoA synthetase (AMP-forming)
VVQQIYVHGNSLESSLVAVVVPNEDELRCDTLPTRINASAWHKTQHSFLMVTVHMLWNFPRGLSLFKSEELGTLLPPGSGNDV